MRDLAHKLRLAIGQPGCAAAQPNYHSSQPIAQPVAIAQRGPITDSCGDSATCYRTAFANRRANRSADNRADDRASRGARHHT